MPVGHINKWFPERGFGFIKRPGTQDIYAHISGFLDRLARPTIDAKVKYQVSYTNRDGYGKRPIATDIEMVRDE